MELIVPRVLNPPEVSVIRSVPAPEIVPLVVLMEDPPLPICVTVMPLLMESVAEPLAPIDKSEVVISVATVSAALEEAVRLFIEQLAQVKVPVPPNSKVEVPAVKVPLFVKSPKILKMEPLPVMAPVLDA